MGRKLEKTVWPYFVKQLLNAHALRRGALHLKAACFALDGEATLLVARGSGGKTVCLAQMCSEGATFISNTHIIVSQKQVEGVYTSLRVRDDECFGPLIHQRRLESHMTRGEYNLDPKALFPSSAAAARLRNLCIVDYRAGVPARLEPLSARVACDLTEQLGFPINTYGMKDDFFELYGAEILAFAEGYAAMKTVLRETIGGLNCLFVRSDLMQAANRRALRAALAAGRASE